VPGQTFVNRCLRRIMGMRWAKVISDTELWEATGQKRVILRIVSEKMAVDRSYK
jgi:hypothetical protein